MSSWELDQTNLDRWLARIGLREKPLGWWQTDYHQALPGYFVDIGAFSDLLRLAGLCLVFARRGCDKTAQCRPLRRDVSRLAATYTYDGFEWALRAAGGDAERLRALHHVGIVPHLVVNALAEIMRIASSFHDSIQQPTRVQDQTKEICPVDERIDLSASQRLFRCEECLL